MLCRRDAEFYRKRNSTEIAPTLPTDVLEQQSANAFSIRLSFVCFILTICVLNVFTSAKIQLFFRIFYRAIIPPHKRGKEIVFQENSNTKHIFGAIPVAYLRIEGRT